MGKKKPDSFLSQMSKLFNGEKIIKLTIKRNLKEQYPQLRKRLKRKQKQQLLNEIKTANDVNEIIIRSQTQKLTISTSSNKQQINKFADSLSNIYRLYCHDQQKQNKKKPVLLPTQPNAKSKTQQRLKAKKLRNKERRQKRNELQKLKKKELQRQKTFASKKREDKQQ
ncbi:unnamed protein product [Paramecium primaurelia]|uniref:Uncharacterized protein n=2 Tax=Paramecium TaxID=5884 RepID=A0A8S1VJE8_9CILI|nr:unnamed protein product [Paramecium primaurelia]CAD8176881.1 unnamed protein product [Paramecium pentaurelia]